MTIDKVKISEQENNSKSYYQIIRSAGLFGGAQLFNILIGIIRNKVVAIFLGNVGMGLISIYQSTLDLIKSVTCLGIDITGIREIATATEDPDKLIKSVSTIYKSIWILALLSGISCFAFSSSISRWAFESDAYSQNIAWLSICLFFNILTIGEFVILQGLRQIGYMIKSSLVWNLISLVILIPLYYLFGIEAIVPAFIIVSIITYLCNLYYRKKIGVKIVTISYQELLLKGKFIIRIGFFIILATIQTQITLFIVKSKIINQLGLEQLGLLQAVWTITNVHLTLILKSMSADYYPRISAICNDNEKIKKLINEQVHVLLIISLPVLIILLVFSKILLTLLYSSSFESAYTLLNWRTLGMFFKVITWALGFVFLAKGKGLIYFISDTLYSIIYLSCIYFLLPAYGINSVGVAYFIAYVAYTVIVYIILRQLISFRWESPTIKAFIICLAFVLIIFCGIEWHTDKSMIIVILFSIVSFIYSAYQFNRMVQIKELIKNKMKLKK